MKKKKILAGIATYLPGMKNRHIKGTGGTDPARYCYSVWLRHLVKARENGLNTSPRIAAELGPGDSLGIGLAALLTGAERYFAFDVVEHASIERNLGVFEELVELFRSRSPIPGTEEWPRIKPHIDDLCFPATILDESRMEAALSEDRVDRIRSSIRNWQGEDSMIDYRVPWFTPDVMEGGTVGMIFSQAVLEHVVDPAGTYEAMYSWLEPSGFISHTIDYKSHGTADHWNGHWEYSALVWRLMKGRRPFLINRLTHSAHVDLVREKGFDIVSELRYRTASDIPAVRLAAEFSSISGDDLETSEGFIQGVKRPV